MTYGTIAITGAAGAIGASLARAFRTAWPDARLALVDRDRAGLDAIAASISGTNVHSADLGDLATLPDLVADIERGGPIDALVNCAGVMRVQQLSSWDWTDAESLLAVDLVAPLRLQALVVRGMVERRHGLLVNVASMAGRVPLRGCAYYGAAKAGLAMASEIARVELAEAGVRVVTVYPGPVRSQLERGAREAFGGGGMIGRFAPTGDPEELARRIVVAIERGEPRVIYPRVYEVGWHAPNFSRWITLTYGPPPVA